MKNKPTIIYEDEAIIVANKPPRLLTIPDRQLSEKHSLKRFLMEKYGDLFIVHRLDKETSGVICFALNAEAHRHISMQFEHRKTKKIYYAIVQGVVQKDEGIIDLSLAPHPSISGKMAINRAGKRAETHYKVIERFKNFTVVECDIKTGRMHQIRVHLKQIGHPIVADDLYGAKDGFYVSDVKGKKYKTSKDEIERPMTTRVALHAFRLGMTHPVTEKWVEYEAELPKDMRAIMTQLRKWGKA